MTRMRGNGPERGRAVAPLVSMIVVVLALAGSAAAQTRRGNAGEAADPAEIARLFDAYTVMQAQETLGLSDEQFGPFREMGQDRTDESKRVDPRLFQSSQRLEAVR